MKKKLSVYGHEDRGVDPRKHPKWIQGLLKRITAPHLQEEILGDMEELFYRRRKRYGDLKARLLYILDFLCLLHPRLWRAQPSPVTGKSYKIRNDYPKTFYLNPAMFKNYLKIALRNLTNNKGYSAINIGGLAVGMAVSMLIGLWIHDELTYDRYHRNYNRIAQVMQTVNLGGDIITQAQNPAPLGKELRATYGKNFKYIVTSTRTENHVLASSDNKFTKRGRFMEAQAPELFTLKMLEGSPTGLNEPGSGFAF